MTSAPEEIVTWLQPEDVLLDVEIRDRAHALQTIAGAIGQAHGLAPEPILRALERREQAASTALGTGFAIPHARIGGLNRPLTLFMRSTKGIAFDAPDGQPVRDFLAIMVPIDGDKSDHLRLLSLISELFSNRMFRVVLDGAIDAETAAAVFRTGVERFAGSAR